MKKAIALLCAATMIISLCGCRGTVEETSVVSWVEGGEQISTTVTDNNSDGNSSNGASTNNSSIDSGKGNTKIENPLKVDLKGATITIYDTGVTFNPDASLSKTNKAKADMLKKIQKELNCKFKITSTTGDKIKSFATTSAASGKALCGIIAPSMYDAGYFISANLVTNLTKVSSMDLSKEYMNRYGVLNASQFGSAKYAVSAEGEGRTFVVFFNKRILKELGYSENYIYDLVDSGKWTYEAYRDLAKKAMKDLDGKSGMSENDQWGQMLQDASTGIMSCVVASYGTSMLKLSADGKLLYNMTDPKIMSALNLCNDFIMKDGTRYTEGQVEDRVKLFANGKSLFLYSLVQSAPSLADMKDEFGLAPSPQVTATKNYVSANDFNCRVLMMPAGLSAQDQYNAGAVIQAYQYLYDDVLDVMEDEYINRYFCDDESGKNWRMAAEKMTTMPQQFYSKADAAIQAGTYRIFWDAFSGKISSPATVIDSQKSAVEKALEDLNAKIKDK